MATPPPQAPPTMAVPIGIQTQAQSLSPDIVEKLLDESGTTKKLNGLLYSADEVRIKEPIYEDAERIKLKGGIPEIDPTTNKPVMEKYQKKIGEVDRRKFIPFYEPHTPLVNLHGLYEVREMIGIAIGGTLQSTSFEDLDLEDTAKDIAQSITNLLTIRHDEYAFGLSTSKTIVLFKDLSMVIVGALNRSNRTTMLNLIANTHNVNVTGGFQQLPQRRGFVETIKRLATGGG